jgi:hypothetical protein
VFVVAPGVDIWQGFAGLVQVENFVTAGKRRIQNTCFATGKSFHLLAQFV